MSDAITTQAFSRAGLLGNPSDGYGGKTISLIVRNFCAQVTIEPDERVAVIPGRQDQPNYSSVFELIDEVKQRGYYGGVRLLKAAIKKFVSHAAQYCPEQFCRDSSEAGFSISYQSDIPQNVGLAGSSAIVVAALKGLAQFYQVDLEPGQLASLALAVERDELGIPAGLQDRVIQSYEGLVYMDFSKTVERHGLIEGSYEQLDPSGLPRLYIAYGSRAGEPTETLHGSLRDRFQSGDPTVVKAMHQFADFAEQGRRAIEQSDGAELGRLIDANFDLRNQICDLHPFHRRMIETARAAEATAKYCGSGGAIIGTYRDETHYQALADAMAQIGCDILQPQVVTS